MDDWEDFDDWSETEEFDSSDTWDDADDESTWNEFGVSVLEDEDDWGEGAGAGDGGGLEGVGSEAAGRAEGSSVSAWEFGTAAAVAGWLLDRQAEQIVAGVQRERAAAGADAVREPAWRRLAPPRVDPAANPLESGALLQRDRLAAIIQHRLAEHRDLAIEAGLDRAPARDPANRLDPAAVEFTVVVTGLVPDAPVWVMLPERPGGFSRLRLQPVFADRGPEGVACCFVDSGPAAVAVVEWALARYGLMLGDFRWRAGF